MGASENKASASVADRADTRNRLMTAAEAAAPGEAIDVVAEHLRKRFDAKKVSFLIVDLTGRAVARLSTATVEDEREVERIGLSDSVYGQVIREQSPFQETTDRGQRIIAPVSNRGDAIGLLELLLPDAPGSDVLEAVSEAARFLAYIVIANRQFTDLYVWGRRTTRPSLAAEIQYQLLPSSLSFESEQFALSGNLEPSEDISGDTFDYILDRDILHLSITDPMGHNLNAALTATVLMGALRSARRASAGLAEQARQADVALSDHGHGHATGQLLRIHLRTGRAELVNAGHPWPLRMRDEVVTEVECEVDHPFGLALPSSRPYRVQELDLRPGDRLVILTDGMLEREAANVDLPDMMRTTRHLHPREAALALTTAVLDACGGQVEDDATVMCLDWHGTT